jgi:hypothetical protein
MCCTEGIDTTTIAPLSVAAPVNVSSVLTSPFGDVGTLEGVPIPVVPPDQNSAAAPDAIQTDANFPPIPPAAPPATVSLSIPDIASMESELQKDGSLLSNLKVHDHQATSPLAHLQPTHLVQTPEGPKPAYSPPVVPPPGQTIQLASTAPVMHSASPTQSLYLNQKENAEPTTKEHHIVSGILIALTLASLGILGMFMYNQYTIAQATVDQAQTSVINAFLQSLPFVEKKTIEESPLPVWYQ